jgi:hypothetical protein
MMQSGFLFFQNKTIWINVILVCGTIGLILSWVRYQRVWAHILRWLRVLWVCRVSLASVLVGFLFLTFVPQAQDVFVDTSVGPGYWASFFFFLFFGWAFAVHYAARRILDREEWGVQPYLIGAARTAELDRVRELYSSLGV